MITWDGIVSNYHKKYLKELGVTNNIEAYIQARVLKATLETVSFDYRRGIEDGFSREEDVEKAVEKLSNALVGGIRA